jgi:hypothetical protein
VRGLLCGVGDGRRRSWATVICQMQPGQFTETSLHFRKVTGSSRIFDQDPDASTFNFEAGGLYH